MAHVWQDTNGYNAEVPLPRGQGHFLFSLTGAQGLAERFARNDIPAGRVLTIPETVQLDLFQHRTILQTVETEHGPIRVVGSGFRLEHGGGSVERPPARLGQHTDEVLREAGYSDSDIAGMRADKVA